MNKSDPFDLERFVKAQNQCYERVIAELDQGRKVSHWMWFVFPQVAGLGQSARSEKFSIKSENEAKAYLQHPVLGERLLQCISKTLRHSNLSAGDIFGYPDLLKFHSCLTLFYILCPEQSLYKKALDVFYRGKLDQKTVNILGVC